MALSLVDTIGQRKDRADPGSGSALEIVGDEELTRLRDVVVQKLRKLSDLTLASLPELDLVLHRWKQWDDPAFVAERMGQLFASDDYLPLALEGFLRYGSSQSIEDALPTRVAHLNPKDFEDLVDIAALEQRVAAMLRREDLSADQRQAGEQYLKAMSQIREGKDPGNRFADIED